jgi:DNA-binding phage protein
MEMKRLGLAHKPIIVVPNLNTVVMSWREDKTLQHRGHYKGFEILSRGGPFKDSEPEGLSRNKQNNSRVKCFILALMPDAETGLARKFDLLAGILDERMRRLVAAAEAEANGFGGVTAVARASGLSRGTVIRGMAELKIAPQPARATNPTQRGGTQNND